MYSFHIDAETGALTPAPNSPVVLPQEFNSARLVISPTGQFLYVESSAGLWVFRIDGSSGAVAQVPDTPLLYAPDGSFYNYNQITINPTGRYLYSLGGTATCPKGGICSYAIDAVTGLPTTIVGQVGPLTGCTWVGDGVCGFGNAVVSANGQFLFVSAQNGLNVLHAGDDGSLQLMSTMALPWPTTPLGDTPVGNKGFQELLADPLGRFLFGAASVGTLVSVNPITYNYTFVFQVDGSNGTLSPPGGAGFPTFPGDIAIDAGGKFLYGPASNVPAVYAIGEKGSLTLVSNSVSCCAGPPAGFVTVVNLPSQ